MKCQNCGINYYDDDKVCPMCGVRSGAKGRLSAPRYTGYGHKEGAEPCTHQTFTREAGNRKPVRPPRPADSRGTLLNGKPVKKKGGRGVGVAVALVIGLLNIMPPAIEWVGDRVRDVGYGIEEALDGYGGDYGSDADEADAYEGMVLEPLLEGQWHTDRAGGGALELNVDGEDRYTLVITSPEGWTLQESGTVTLWEEPQEDGVYDERFPPETYDCYSLYLSAEDIQLAQSAGAAPETIAQHRQEGILALLVYQETAAPDSGFLLYDYGNVYAPLFPPEPERLLRKQAA